MQPTIRQALTENTFEKLRFSGFASLSVFRGFLLRTILLVFAVSAFAREPWLTSRIVGSPDPPAPYISERVFPNLKFREPVELTPMPGTDRLIIVEREAKIYSFPNRNDCEKPDLFANM